MTRAGEPAGPSRNALESVLRRSGVRVRMTACKAMARRAGKPERRTLYLIEALICALALGDARAMGELTELWATAGGAARGAAVLPTLQAMLDAGFVPEGLALARAEARRWPRARAFYLEGRCLAGAGDAHRERALAAFSAARTRAENEGDARVAAAASARRIALLQADEGTLEQALEEADALASEALEPRDRLLVATVALRSPRRFVRARAIDRLLALARTSPAMRASAVGAALRHADRYGAALGPEEFDRLAALLALWPDANAREDGLRRLEASRAARHAADAPMTDEAVLANARRDAGPVARQALDAVAASLRGHRAELLAALEALGATFARDPRGPDEPLGPAWTAGLLGAGNAAGDVRRAAVALLERLLEARPTERPPPPRGFVALLAPLLRAGRPDLARRALALGIRAREPSARERWIELTVDVAWRVRASAPDEAIALLRRAKAEAERASPPLA